MRKQKVAFVCVHNACRSQIAEALAKHYGNDKYEFYSAGTVYRKNINQDAVRLLKELYDIDMEKEQFPKLLDKLPQIDILVTMGCDAKCPNIVAREREDWSLDDPTGKSDVEFIKVIKLIEKKIKEKFC